VLRISKLTDYAIIICALMANELQDGASATRITEKTQLGGATVKKVLRLLLKGHIVASAQGASGGYTLNANPHDTSIADIIAAMEGNLALTECSTSDGCKLEGACHISHHWQTINQVVMKALSCVTLDQLKKPHQPWQPIEFEQAKVSS
jgi:FeS assembly SUF system regulator